LAKPIGWELQIGDFVHFGEQVLKKPFHPGISIRGWSAGNLAIRTHRISSELLQGTAEQSFVIPSG
jgi:hypothetical protein